MLEKLAKMNCLILCLPLTYVVKSLWTSLSRQWNEEKLKSKQSIILVHALFTIGRLSLFTLKQSSDIDKNGHPCVNRMAIHTVIKYVGTVTAKTCGSKRNV